MFRSCLVLSLAFALASFASTAPAPLTIQPDIERRIDTLLARMTLEEKLGQLQMLDGEANGNSRPEHRELIRKGLLGSTLNVRSVERTNELQRIAVDQSRLKIPLLFAFDVIHGYRTIFPVPLALASSWDPATVERAAAISAAEASAAGVRWTFAPMLDITRDPRWGRIVEGAGEDPYLSAAMARAQVLGFQGRNYGAQDRIIACAKHWVAYGAAEGGRDYNTTDLSERSLRETYFPPFKAALDAGVGTFMSAFNDLNGIPATANPFTLTTVLRGEWKFDGPVVSDYESVRELINHGLAAGEADAAREAISAGTDVEMVSRLYNKHIPALLKDGKVSQTVIDEAVRRVLRIKLRLGLFEKPYADGSRQQTIGSLEYRRASREIAARSIVLLKNSKDLLPLSKNLKSLAVIGPLADDQGAPMGSWSGDGRREDVVTLLAGIKARLSPSAEILYAKGCEIEGDSTDGFAEAVLAASKADAVVVAVGESAEMSGEAACRTTLDLPGKQLELVKALVATNKPVVAVLMNGRPLTVNWIASNVDSILETWFAGTEAGDAIADVLFGDVNPGGKLPVTFPRTVGQIPIYYNHKSTGRPADPSNKYTSKYLDEPVSPLFQFGFGLSYSTFKLSDIRLSESSIRRGGRATVSVDVENTGKYAGDEVVQLYIKHLAATVTRPIRELRGFQRIHLAPGEKRRVDFLLGGDELGFYNREMRFVVEPGIVRVFVGTSSEGGLESSLAIAGN